MGKDRMSLELHRLSEVESRLIQHYRLLSDDTKAALIALAKAQTTYSLNDDNGGKVVFLRTA